MTTIKIKEGLSVEFTSDPTTEATMESAVAVASMASPEGLPQLVDQCCADVVGTIASRIEFLTKLTGQEWTLDGIVKRALLNGERLGRVRIIRGEADDNQD